MTTQSLVKQQAKAPATFSAFITSEGIRKRINEMMGGTDGQRFVTSIVSAVTNNPALASCEHMSIFSAAMLGESLKLSPSVQLGQFYMVPFKDKKRCAYPSKKKDYNFCNYQCEYNNAPLCKVATFQIGYKGYIQLAIRSGYYKKLNVIAIKEGELIGYDPLNEELDVRLIQDDSVREQKPTIGYYAMFEYLNGFRKTMYWSKEKMEAHADKYSQAFKLSVYRDIQAGKIPERDMWKYSSFWYKDFDGMAFKTMLRQIISKWGVMSTELQQALDGDNAVIVNGEPQYIDTDPVTPTHPEPQPLVNDSQTDDDVHGQSDQQANPEEDFFGDNNGQDAQAQDEPDIDTTDEIAVAAIALGEEDAAAYKATSAADRKKKVTSYLQAFGATVQDGERKVGKGYAQWTAKDRAALLMAYRDLSVGVDPAEVFPTE